LSLLAPWGGIDGGEILEFRLEFAPSLH